MVAGGVSVSSIAFRLAQPPNEAGWLATFALVPLFVIFRRGSTIFDVAIGLAFGTLSALLCATSIAGGLTSLGASPVEAAGVIFLGASWACGVPWALLGLVVGRARRLPVSATIITASAALFVIDAARSHLPGTLPWVLLGHTQWNTVGVAQVAVVGGVPLLSALLAALNMGIASLVTARDPTEVSAAARWSLGLAIGYAALAVGGVPVATAARSQPEPPAVPPLEILLVQPNLAPGERWAPPAQRTNLEILVEQTRTALALHARAPDLIAWPETSLHSPVDRDEALGRELLTKVDALGTPVVLGVVRAALASSSPEIYRNSVLWIAPGRGIVDEFDKTRAVPLVESAGTHRLASLLGLETQNRFAEEGSVQRPIRDEAELAVVFCNESLFPGLLSARRGPETLAILNLANDSWFLTETPSMQQLALSSFRAIEQRLPLLRVAHGGISAVVDPYGRVEARLPFATTGTLWTEVAVEPSVSLAERGALLGLLVAGGVLGAGAATAITRRILS